MERTLDLARPVLAFMCCAVALSGPVFAQTAAAGLFGTTAGGSADRDKLNLVGTIASGLDSEVPLEFASVAPRNGAQSGGPSTILSASADYTRNRRRLQLFGNASTYFRYAKRLDRIDPGSQTAHLGAGFRLSKSGSFQISQSAAYSPSYLYLLLPTAVPPAGGEPIPVNPEFRIDQTESYSYQTHMSLAFGSEHGTRVTATSDYNRTDFTNQIASRRELVTYTAGVRLSRGLSRKSAVSVAYEYSVGKYALHGLTKEHSATMGVTYTPALSVTRRATFRLDMSSSIFDVPESAFLISPAAAEDGRVAVAQRKYPLQGEAGIDYPFRLKWQAGASYRRSVDFVPGMLDPTFMSGVRLRLNGVIGRRVDVSAQAGSANAESVVSRDSRSFRTYVGQARVRYALTRALALYSEYSYYYYDLGEQSHLASGLPNVYEQHGIRVGFMLFAQPVSR